ncbi:MAG: thermonuclease family protein [Candidatus Nitrosotenuis sp.]
MSSSTMRYIALFLISILFLATTNFVFAHKDGCHSKHSCPLDSGTYECGDKGYCSHCPDNLYCRVGQPRTQELNYEKQSYPEPVKSYQEHQKKTTTPKPPTTQEKTKPLTNIKAVACSGTALCISGKVIKIVDGDTIYVKNYKIRLSLTNTPENGKAGFNEAKSFTAKICPVGSVVMVDQDDKQPYDKYQRVVGKVICSGKVLNSELLDNGHANILTKYCKKSEFASESWAKRYGC